jgi:hypothetical protein|tara:strand:- start:183 stop:422 length:240 start_codon:yes stop_codon:yes gene_type:complete
MELKMSQSKSCTKCGATWIEGQHYWSGTGALGNEDDLAGLVCNKLGNDDCINPKRGSEEGITWDDRLDSLNTKQNELDL